MYQPILHLGPTNETGNLKEKPEFFANLEELDENHNLLKTVLHITRQLPRSMAGNAAVSRASKARVRGHLRGEPVKDTAPLLPIESHLRRFRWSVLLSALSLRISGEQILGIPHSVPLRTVGNEPTDTANGQQAQQPEG